MATFAKTARVTRAAAPAKVRSSTKFQGCLQYVVVLVLVSRGSSVAASSADAPIPSVQLAHSVRGRAAIRASEDAPVLLQVI